jgi:hypothetical protein
MEVVQKIGKVKCDAGDNPLTPVMMNSITVE